MPFKIILLIFLLQFPSLTTLYAQNADPSVQVDKNYFGLFVGASFSQIETAFSNYPAILQNPTWYPGVTIGVNYTIEKEAFYKQQFELYYQDKGAQWGRPLFGIGYDGDTGKYRVPVIGISMLHLFNSRIGTLIKQFEFLLGASYAFVLDASQEWLIESDQSIYLPPKNMYAWVNKHQLALILGVKVPFLFKNTQWGIAWHYGVTSLFKNKRPLLTNNGEENTFTIANRNSINMQSILISVEYSIH